MSNCLIVSPQPVNTGAARVNNSPRSVFLRQVPQIEAANPASAIANIGSANWGSNLPALWRPISGLNGAESTVNVKVNSRKVCKYGVGVLGVDEWQKRMAIYAWYCICFRLILI